MVLIPPKHIDLLIPDSVIPAVRKDKIISSWSFLQAGMCDELSLVVAPAADGNPRTQSLFRAQEGLSTDKPISFTLLGAEARAGRALWLRYQVNAKK